MAEGSPSPLYSKTQSPVGFSQFTYLFFFVNPPHSAHLYNLYCVCLPAMLRKMWVMDSLNKGRGLDLCLQSSVTPQKG